MTLYIIMSLLTKTIFFKYYVYEIQGDNYLVSFTDRGVKKTATIHIERANTIYKKKEKERIGRNNRRQNEGK